VTVGFFSGEDFGGIAAVELALDFADVFSFLLIALEAFFFTPLFTALAVLS